MYCMHNCVDMATDTTGELWHKMLCHMTQKGMWMQAEKDLLSQIKNVHLDKCVDCLADKQNKATFRPRPLMRRKNALEHVHTHVCNVDAKSHVGA